MTPPAMVRLDARAKLNLGLAVGPRRPDGYHDLVTVFQSISLCDTLIARRAGRLSLSVVHEDAGERATRAPRSRGGAVARVPPGQANLVLRAARLARERWGLSGGAHFRLIKRIPAGAGLGGGSADAAAALSAMCRLYGVRPSRADRLAAAAELGSDVPFASFGGTAIGRGRGERLERIRLARPFRAVIAVPAWRVSTADAYRQIDQMKYGLTGWNAHLRFAQRLERKALTAAMAMQLGNVFEATLGGRRRDFLDIRRRLERAGTVAPHLTGSGSAVFGILPSRVTWSSVVGRFSGSETLFLVRSARAGVRLST